MERRRGARHASHATVRATTATVSSRGQTCTSIGLTLGSIQKWRAPAMDTKIRQLLGSSPRRIVTSALALGLVLGTSLLFTTAQPVWAVNFVQEVAVETRYAYARQTAEKTCLIRAEQTLAAYGYTVWDPARDNNRTVQGKKASSRVMV